MDITQLIDLLCVGQYLTEILSSLLKEIVVILSKILS